MSNIFQIDVMSIYCGFITIYSGFEESTYIIKVVFIVLKIYQMISESLMSPC